MSFLVGDTIYFDACDAANTYGKELHAHNTVNGSTWMVADINTGSGSSQPGHGVHIVVGDTLYFSAKATGDFSASLWAHDTSNHSTWLAADLFYVGAGESLHLNNFNYEENRETLRIGDTLYFDARGNSGTPSTNNGTLCQS